MRISPPMITSRLVAPSGRYHAVLIAADGGVTHLAARERLEEAMDDADAEGAGADAQVLSLRPRRVVASREAGAAWRRV
jgi:hypothetical protein